MNRIVDNYLISCENSPRLKNYDDLLQSNLLSHVPAIDTRTNPLYVCREHNYVIDIIWYHEHFEEFNGAYGCYMTHHTLWEKIAKMNTPLHAFYCIFEDDVIPRDISKLNSTGYRPYRPIVNLNYRGLDGSEAYVLNSEGARLLITLSNRTITHPVDKYIFKYCRNQFPSMFGSNPCIELAMWSLQTNLKT